MTIRFAAWKAALAGVSVAILCGPAAAQVNELIAERTVRFFAPGAKPEEALPSFALEKPMAKIGEAPADFAVKPVFSKAGDGRQVVRIEIAPGTSLYGTGEVPGPLLRNGRTVTLWNTDAFGYAPEAPSLYQSHPWVMAVRADGTAFGVLADTTWKTEVNLSGAITFTSDGPAFPVIVVDRPSPQGVCTALAEMTGHMPLPPLWAIGYHQCRYSYNPESRVREIADNFRTRKIPCDVIWFDIDYMAGYRIFTFDPREFADPAKLNADLERRGFRCIWMIDPGVKAPGDASPNDPSDADLKAMAPEMQAKWRAQISRFEGLQSSGDKIDAWVKMADGKVYHGGVWPGACVFPDYTSDAVRTWWSGLYGDFMGLGIDGVWNDMNEPAVFNVASKTMPEDNRHRGGTWSSGAGMPSVNITPGPHARFHNVYGMLMAQATRAGISAALPDKRPFVLTRAGYLGSHRYAATWTGDNSANWNDLEQSIPMVLNLGMSGQPLCGPDIGGYNGNGPAGVDEATDRKLKGQLFARWLGFGSLLPFSRGHTAKGNIDKEPWAFGEEVETTCRLALERRYRLIPYLYTLFHEASIDGLPVARPLFFADPLDPALRSEDDSFLLGADLLVEPKVTPFKDRPTIEPSGLWRTIELVGPRPIAGELANADLPVLRLRDGAILPCGPIMQHTGEKPLDPITLLVNPDAFGKAKGVLYEDAGDGYGYKNGEYLLTEYSAVCTEDRCVVTITRTEGKMARPKRNVVVQFVSDGGRFEGSGPDGEPVTVFFK